MKFFWGVWLWICDLFDEYEEWFVAAATALLIVWLGTMLTGCASIPKLKLPSVSVTAPKDVGKPAEASEVTERTGFRVPANSRITVTRTEPLPNEGVLLPGKTQWDIELPEPTDFVQEARAIMASTGTVDASVAIRRVDNAARLPLLYAAIGAVVAAIGLFWMKYPTPAMLAGGAAVVFFISWQAAGLPSWFWVIAIIALASGAGIYFGYERKEKEAHEA